MAGTKEGYQKGRKTNLAKDPDFYKKRAAHAGKYSTHRPFKDQSFAKQASLKGVEARRKKALDNKPRPE